MSWAFDPLAARVSAAAVAGVARHLDLPWPVPVPSLVELPPLPRLADEGLSLRADLLDHAHQLRGAAGLAERHESLLTWAVRRARDSLVPRPVPVLLGSGEALARWLLGGTAKGTATPAPVPAGWALGARSVADWLERSSRLPADSFAVSRLGGDVVVVVLPGIHALGPAPDARDLPGAARELVTAGSAYHAAVVSALASLHLPPGTRVAVVGHSQGGIVAADLARDRRLPGRVTHVVTAGSPVSGITVPAPTRLLELVNPDDAVPRLDGRASPQGPLRTVVSGAHGPVVASHDVSSYAVLAAAPAVEARSDVRGFEASAADWLSGGPAQTTVWSTGPGG